MSISQHLSQRARRFEPAAIRKVVARIKPDFISFTAGRPASALFPLEAIYEQTGHVLEKYGPEAMQYASTLGFQPLRQWLAQRTPPATASNVLLINGSQQAIDLVGRIFLEPGDKVIVSAPTYTTALSTLSVYEVEFLGVAGDENGMLPDQLEAALQQSPKLIYAIPNFMNPSGVSMSLERRQALVKLAEQYDVPILEDDPYGELRFEGEPLPNLFELAPDRVLYAGTFSKIVAPGFRIGWMVVPDEIFEPLMIAKQSTDLQASTYAQMLLYEFVTSRSMDDHFDRIRAYYRQQRDWMIGAMREYLPTAVKFHTPAGGMFCWCELPNGLNAEDLLEEALAAKVAYVPGGSFFPNGEGQNTLRLSFSEASQADIEEGIKRLGEIFAKAIEATAH